MTLMAADAPIGLIDSGIGGLSIWRAIRRLLPNERLAYISDHAFFPYGDKDPEELCVRTEALTRVLLERGCKLIALACTSSTAQSPYTRMLFESFAPDKEMLIVDCQGLESLIEAGELRSAALQQHLQHVLTPVAEAGVDVIGLSCT